MVLDGGHDDEDETVYVGRLGLTGADGSRLLVDWRSPAAEPFFGATHARPLDWSAAAATAGPVAG